MKFGDVIDLGISSIWHNKLRAGLSILGILIGNASVICMIGIGDGAKQIIADDIEKLGGANQFILVRAGRIYRRGRLVRWSDQRFNLDDAFAIEATCPKVTWVLPKNERWQVLFTSKAGKQTRATLEGVTPNYAQGMHWKVKAGRFLTENDFQYAMQVCVLGSQVAADLFGDTSPLGHEVKIRLDWKQVVRCRVVGVMAPKGRNLRTGWSLDTIVCIPLTTYQRRITGWHYVEKISVFVSKESDIDETINDARAVIRKNHRNTDDFVEHWTVTWTFEPLEHMQKVIKIALGGIAGFALFVSGIGIMNICLVSVGEKTRDIGLRKAVGARHIDIFWHFLAESICLCCCGGILGIGCGWLAAHAMAGLAVRIVPIVPKWPVVLSPQWILISVAFSILMGVVFGVYPAIRAARLSPIEALRTDG